MPKRICVTQPPWNALNKLGQESANSFAPHPALIFA